jgi:SAM-dependent methyltransferase
MTDANSPNYWDRGYRSDWIAWDLGGPTPVFQRLAEDHLFQPGTMLVLGAGYGHDARLFARHGFVVTAVDFSVEAVEAMRRLDDPEFSIKIVQADFFSLSPDWNDRFDYILDYTSFCSVIPGRRPEYADMVARLLRSQGKYIILAFPIGEYSGGPPFAIQPNAVIDLFKERKFSLQLQEAPFDSVTGRWGSEELIILAK